MVRKDGRLASFANASIAARRSGSAVSSSGAWLTPATDGEKTIAAAEVLGPAGQDVEQGTVLGVDPPGGLRAHSLTTRMVRSERSLAPRTRPPWASESAMYSKVGPVSLSPGSTFGTPGG